jgi:hypothetical protein
MNGDRETDAEDGEDLGEKEKAQEELDVKDMEEQDERDCE